MKATYPSFDSLLANISIPKKRRTCQQTQLKLWLCGTRLLLSNHNLSVQYSKNRCHWMIIWHFHNLLDWPRTSVSFVMACFSNMNIGVNRNGTGMKWTVVSSIFFYVSYDHDVNKTHNASLQFFMCFDLVLPCFVTTHSFHGPTVSTDLVKLTCWVTMESRFIHSFTISYVPMRYVAIFELDVILFAIRYNFFLMIPWQTFYLGSRLYRDRFGIVCQNVCVSWLHVDEVLVTSS